MDKNWNPRLALAVAVLLEALVALQAGLAYRDQFLTVSQMQGRGISFGLPFIWHFGMWGDIFIISPLAAYLMGHFWSTWRARWISLSLLLGIAVSIGMGWSYTFSEVQEAHVRNHHLTSVGMVHGIYMALALAIFTQFIFFTENISSRILRVASVLLIVHVFLGTHMGLGLLQLFLPLGWYPAQPLQSVVGWSIIGSVAIVLLWRNVGSARSYRAFVVTYMFLTSEDPRPLEGHLKFLNRLSDLTIATTYFFKLFWAGLIVSGRSLSLWLLLLIAIRYFFSRVSVKQELEIGKTLYPPGKVPDDLIPKTRKQITIRVIGFLIIYTFLGYLSDHIFWASILLTIISCNDYRTRSDISSNILRTFEDSKYAPLKGENGYQKIMDKREVARWYLSDLPTRSKEGLCAVGCALALGIVVYGYVMGVDLDLMAYVILIATLSLNEIVTLLWRIERFRRLLAIDRR